MARAQSDCSLLDNNSDVGSVGTGDLEIEITTENFDGGNYSN